MNQQSLILENALLLPAAGTPRHAALAIRDDRIAGLDDAAVLRHRFPAAQTLDFSGHIILPGLINAHLHPELHLLKGMVEELDLHDWAEAEHFDTALALLSAPEGRAWQRAGIRAALADCLLTGTSCVATYGVTAEADEIAAAAIEELGLRGHVTIRDTEFAAIKGPLQPAYRLRPPRMYRLHAEEALTERELAAAAAAHARGERLVMHAAETEQRLRIVIEQFGTSTMRLLDRYGLLSERMLLSHAVYVDDEERALLAVRRVPVVSSPTAEMKLSDGLAPIVDYLRAGITVALGTDCAICNNSNDMFLEMRQLGLAQKLRYGADTVSAEQILLTATVHGARALGHEGELGALAEGMLADLTLVNTRNLRLQPLVSIDGFSNVAANLVYAATGQDVTDVMVGGKWVVRERRLQTASLDEILSDLAHAAEELYLRILNG